jgi:hypothetical protein
MRGRMTVLATKLARVARSVAHLAFLGERLEAKGRGRPLIVAWLLIAAALTCGFTPQLKHPWAFEVLAPRQVSGYAKYRRAHPDRQ